LGQTLFLRTKGYFDKMRHKTNQTDSLELLLDTICNMFGGVFLMAVLVVLQTQMSASRIPNQKEVSLETEKLHAEYKQLNEKVIKLESQRVILASQYTQSSSDQTDNLLKTKDQFSEALDNAKDSLVEMTTQLTQAQRDRVTSEMAIDAIEKKLQTNQKQIIDLEQQVQTTVGQKENVRLPHQQLDSFKSPRYYLIKDDKVYPFWGEGARDWSGEPFVSESCTITPKLSGLSMRAITVEPYTRKGIPVSDKGGVNSAFFSTLRGCRPSTHYTVFFVYADGASFSSFQRLKQAVLDEGYLYSVSAYFSENGIVLHPGTPKVE